MWPFGRKGASGFSWYSTAEEVTAGIDGSGLIAIVTGASSGIGAETARVLAARGVHVIIAVRDLSNGDQVLKAILEETPDAKADVMMLDLSSLSSVRKFALEFKSRNLPLNILVNNAGIMASPFMLSDDGIELQFATNHLGHFLLTELLLENMKHTSQESKREGRIIVVSSEAHRVTYGEGINFDLINEKSAYSTVHAYGQSKLANILHANELSRRLKEQGVRISVNSLHPGVITTNLWRYHSLVEYFLKLAGGLLLKTTPQGASTSCYLALHPQVTGTTGKYFCDNNISNPSAKAKDTDLARKLWDFSVKMVS